MATQNTTLFNNQIVDLTRNAVMDIRPTDVDGKIRVVVDRYTTTSEVTASSQHIVLCKLPKGAKLISAELLAGTSGPAYANLGIGTINWDGSVTVTASSKYGEDIALDTADVTRFQLADNPETVVDYVTESDVALVLTPTSGNFANAWSFSFIIMYITAN